MTKFEELCAAYAEAQQEFKSFQADSIKFAESMWRALMTDFGIPAGQLTLYRINPKGAFELANPPFEQVMGLRQDGFWEFGIGISLFVPEKGYPRDTVLMYLLVRKSLNGHFQVRINDEQQVFDIDPMSKHPFENFFTHIFETIKSSYKTGLERLLHEKKTNRIGFDLDEITKNTKSV